MDSLAEMVGLNVAAKSWSGSFSFTGKTTGTSL